MSKYLLIIVAAGLIGCTGVMKTTEGTRFTHEEVQKLKTGTSTQEDVVALLGQPDDKKDEDGMVKYIYTYRINRRPTYLGGVIKSGSTKTTTRKLEVLIKDGTVYSYKFREEAEQ